MQERLVVDNRVFLLGLDALYRSAMKHNEGFKLLRCAREVAWTLHVQPADVPVEGYYAEDERLTEYFRLLRALQEEPTSRVAAVERLPAYQRLYEVTSSPLYGRPRNEDKLLPVGHERSTHNMYGPGGVKVGLTGRWAVKVMLPSWLTVRVAARLSSRWSVSSEWVRAPLRVSTTVSITSLRSTVTLSGSPWWSSDGALTIRGRVPALR